MGIHTRYPGAQPFADDDLSRKVFFGREEASIALTNQILANRMVVVYAKSGLGKSSLLNAGVAQRLRDEGYLPLFVRVNDLERGPLVSVMDEIGAAAERQNVEYVPGRRESLWTFFKTVEFWRGDLLLTPVLLLDQFEELFTLQGADQRAAFIADLGYLVRGVRPPSVTAAEADLSEAPPAVRIVLSIREDFLGFLDEAADRIPQILDHRFRLMPLSAEAAAEAMIGPAGIDDPTFETRPFRYDSETVGTILGYLSRRRSPAVAEKAAFVEPFHLQLICQRVEAIAARRQQGSQPNLTITVHDIGGEVQLKRILKDFYSEALGTLRTRRVRRAARRLCEDYLISPEGRRLSLEEHEILRQLKLPAETLKHLVNSRLLRSDSRSDSTYYELSHDALVVPVLETRRAKSTAVGLLSIASGALIFIVAGSLAVFVTYLTASFYIYGGTWPTWIAPHLVDKKPILATYLSIFAFAVLALYALLLVRRGLRTIRRYHRLSDVSIQLEPAAGRAKDKITGWLGLGFGSIILVISIFLFLLVFMVVINPIYSTGMPELLVDSDDSIRQWWQSVRDHGLRFDSLSLIVGVLACVVLGTELSMWGVRKAGGFSRRATAKVAASSSGRRPIAELASGSAALVAGTTAILVAVFWVGSILLAMECSYYSGGRLPGWLSENWFNGIASMTNDCRSSFQTGFKLDADIFLGFVFVSILSAYGARFLRKGFRKVRRLTGIGRALYQPHTTDGQLHLSRLDRERTTG